jgi:hypothetical protein
MSTWWEQQSPKHTKKILIAFQKQKVNLGSWIDGAKFCFSKTFFVMHFCIE